MGLKVTNNAFGTLNAGINSSATTIVLTAGQGARFPTLSAGDYFYATLIDTSNNLEIVKVTARSTDTMTIVRGQDSTTARAYATNDRFELRPTAILFNEKANANEYLPLAGGTMTGALGVGATPLAHIHSTKAGAEVARFTNSQSNGGDWEFKIGGGGFEDRKLMITDKYGSTDNVRLSIDSSGRVVTPQKPMLRATVSGASNITFVKDATTTIPFNYKNEFTGSDFNTSTYTFTCPVAGVYFVHAAVQVSGVNPSGGVGPNLFLQKNGGAFSGTYHVVIQSAGYQKLESTGLVKCSAGDTIVVALYQGNQTYSGGSTEFAGDMRNGLYICLLG